MKRKELFQFIIILIIIQFYCINKVKAENTIPFTTHKKLIIINAKINGVEGNFLFDNGFTNSALNTSFLKKINQKFRGKMYLSDANAKRLKVKKGKVKKVEIGGYVFANAMFHEINTDVFFPCYHIDGVIGASIINSINWKINFDTQEISLSESPFETNNKLTDTLEVSYSKSGGAYIELNVLNNNVKCKVDLGSSKAIQLRKEGLIIPDSVFAEERVGVFSLSAAGLGNIDTTYKIHDVSVYHRNRKTNQLTEVDVKSSLKRKGYIGVDFFNDYNLIINNSDKEYLLLPRKDSLDKVVKSYGLVLYVIDGELKVLQKLNNYGLVKDVKLMSVVEKIDGEDAQKFQTICQLQKYMKQKILNKEDLLIQIESKEINLPYAIMATTSLK